ncbi:MAG: tRNA (N(6)-L-threonylcarbamoyladenosine(37)-C(2))-methylthiotransferase MtaB [Dehalococcoidia bacterium]|nr:tRNA (N(6)-L-threonylcarbamoyladenosine(37)-C(2))-methylthiotransferase MtaB [Dehalococcoidia bacterium]
MKVALYTLGCKLNQAETELLASRFSEAGYQLVASNEAADICIANTCTVTHIADRKSRHWLRMARRRNPDALIVATGCYAQRAPQELAPLADLVSDNGEKGRLLETVQGLLPRVFPPPTGKPCRANLNGNARIRSLIKIQDGCNTPCSYCIVPTVRPYEYSLPPSMIIEQIEAKVTAGYREVVLTGTKVGCYSCEGKSLGDLVRLILSETGIERLRLSSLQPQEISPDLLSLWQDKRLCRHFHLALQSGSEATLRKMKRRYALNDYVKTTHSIREAIPGAAITTDIMVGFPGESDEDFEQSYRFCQQADFAGIHVFPYSRRQGTEADALPNQVRNQTKQARTWRMLELAQACQQKFREQFAGNSLPVLWEKETSPGSGIYSGLTDNYIRVFARSRRSLSNKITAARLLTPCKQGMQGELADENQDSGETELQN